MHVPQQKLAAALWRRIARHQRHQILAPRMHPLPQPRPPLLLTNRLQQIRHPAFAVRRLRKRPPHRVHAGRLNQLLQRFHQIERHGGRL